MLLKSLNKSGLSSSRRYDRLRNRTESQAVQLSAPHVIVKEYSADDYRILFSTRINLSLNEIHQILTDVRKPVSIEDSTCYSAADLQHLENDQETQWEE